MAGAEGAVREPFGGLQGSLIGSQWSKAMRPTRVRPGPAMRATILNPASYSAMVFLLVAGLRRGQPVRVGPGLLHQEQRLLDGLPAFCRSHLNRGKPGLIAALEQLL